MLLLKISTCLKDKELIKKARELYQEYAEYCTSRSLRPLKNTIFYQKLHDVTIDQKTLHGYKVYRYSAETLMTIAKNKNWLHETDELAKPNNKQKPDFSKYAFDDLEHGIEKDELAINVDKNNDIIDENKRLRERIKQLETNNTQLRYEQLYKKFQQAGFTQKPKKKIVKPKKHDVDEYDNGADLIFDLNNF